MPDNNIRALAVDGAGGIWIGTLSGGVSRFYNNTWTTYNTSNSGLPGNFIRAITFDRSGNVWLGSSAGLIRFDGTNWTVWNNSNAPLISHHVTSIEIGKDSTVYFGTINGGLVYLKDTAFTFYNLWNNQLPDNTILSVALDTSGNRWLGMPSGGIAVDYGAGVWQKFNMITSTIPSDAFNHVFVDRNNKVYMGSQDKGLVIRNGLDFLHYDSLNSELPDVNVLTVIKDRSGILWVGTMFGGLVRLDETMSVNSTKNKIGLKVINSFVRSGDDILIECKEEDVVSIIDVNGKVVAERHVVPGLNVIQSSFGSGMFFLKPGGSNVSGKIVVF